VRATAIINVLALPAVVTLTCIVVGVARRPLVRRRIEAGRQQPEPHSAESDSAESLRDFCAISAETAAESRQKL
jgi:hypothetical protein